MCRVLTTVEVLFRDVDEGAGEVWHSPQALYSTIYALRARVKTVLVRADEAYEAADTTIFGLSFRPRTAVHAKFTSGGTLGPC